MSIPTYTQYPRAVLWLLRGDDFQAGPPESVFWTEVGAFYIAKHPITNVQFEAFRPHHVRGQCAQGDHDPAVHVSFVDAVAYCNWYSEVSQKKFRLPTEMEWEYACAYGSRARYPWGDDSSGASRFAWTAENSGGVCHEVGVLEANEPGLHDMVGGVWEWTSSLARPFPVDEGDGRDDLDAEGERVQRGGCFRDSVGDLSSWSRRGCAPDERLDNAGFRIVRSL